MRCWRCCTAIAKRRSFNAASAGKRDRRRSGTIAAPSTTRCGTISRSAATATASRSRATARTDKTSVAPHPVPLPVERGEGTRLRGQRDTSIVLHVHCRKLSLSPRGERAGVRGLLQVLAEIGLDVAPQFLRRRFAVARPVIGEKGVSGVLVDLCRDILPGRLGALLELGFERDRRVLVLFTENAEERAVQLADHIERRFRTRRRRLGVGRRAANRAPAHRRCSRYWRSAAPGRRCGRRARTLPG